MTFFKGKVRQYDPQEHEKKSCRLLLLKQMNEKGVLSPLDGALSIAATFYLPIPKSVPKSKRNSLHYHSKRPDIDNYLKFYLDVFNLALFLDDGQVCEIHAKKIYSDNPRSTFEVKNV